MIRIEKATKKFMGATVLDSVSVTFLPGDKVALMGPNGAGKTTLVRSVLGFYRLDGGEIEVFGNSPYQKRTAVLERIAFIPQTPPPIKLSVKELCEYISKSSGVEVERIAAEADRMDLDLKGNGDKPFFKLSGGMKQKLLIAIALSRKSDIFIFDEPTANLDPKARERFYALLKELNPESIAVYITHRIEELGDLVNRTVYMDLGKITEDRRIA